MNALARAAIAALLLARAPLASAAPGGANSAAPAPPPLAAEASEVGIDEHLGRSIQTALPFTDMSSRRVRLADYFDGRRPVLLVLAYYRCPALCGLVLRGVVMGLSKLDWEIEEQYRALAISIDPSDTPRSAALKREPVLSSLGLDAPDDGRAFPFLVGGEPEIRALTDDIGFRFSYDPRTDQYAHPAAAIVLTPEGRISRYLYGIEFSPRDLRLALLEASEGKTGSAFDRVLMTCYRYDPASRRYGPFVAGFFRLGAFAILATVGVTLAALSWRERKRRAEGSER